MSKCILILSEKSSGSSACQNLLSKFADIRHVKKTRHGEFETLYWTKAVSILGRASFDMVDSEVPLPYNKARSDLLDLLNDNIPDYQEPNNDTELIFEGWRRLCEQFRPIFLEKSPHHLCQWSALELIEECMARNPEIEFLVIGLVRNPMDTIYSQFRRWGTRPEALQAQWITAYENLLRFQERLGEKLILIRYEDMVNSLDTLRPVFDFLGVTPDDASQNYLHRESLFKWKADRLYGYAPSDEIKALGRRLGYVDDSMNNSRHVLWPEYREYVRFLRSMRKCLKKLRRRGRARR